MLHRQLDNGTLLVSQPAHAWVSGQLAAAWGNDRFGVVEPYDEVCLAAEQHDIGWLEWEANPTLNPTTGLPRTFMDLPTMEHVSVWSPAGPRSLVYGPYVALLVSMHGTGLYQRHDFTRDTMDEAEAARRFMSAGAAFEEQLLAQMANIAALAPYINPETVARNRRLVAIWDALSLALCGGIADTRELTNVPSARDPLTIEVRRFEKENERFAVDPWPFGLDTTSVRLSCAGRRIQETFTEQEAMRAAVAAAPWRHLDFELVPN